MPAHSGHLSDPAQWVNPPVPISWVPVIYETMPVFDPQLTECWGIGTLPERFRHMPGTLRSDHPQNSFSAAGMHATEITKSQPLTPAFGVDSPLGRLEALAAKVLFLGTDYETCTCFHLAESRLPGMPRKQCGTPVLEDGIRIWKWFEDYDYDADDFQAVGDAFELIHPVRTGNIGIGKGRLFDIKDAVAFAEEWLKIHRSNLLT